MSILVGDNFQYSASKPLDGRLKYDTVANMKAVADATMYDGCLAYCVATDKTYQWKSTNTVDETTGRWREFSSGGGGGTSDYTDLTNKPSINNVTLSGNKTTSDLNISYNDLTNKPTIPSITDCYQTGDTAETSLADDDYVPFYDTSASSKRKTLWSNVKSVLKSLFDSLYEHTPTIKTATLDANATSVTFTGIPTSGNYRITLFISDPAVEYLEVDNSTAGTLVYTFEAQTKSVTLQLVIAEG